MYFRAIGSLIAATSLFAAPGLPEATNPQQSGFSAERLQRVREYVRGVVDQKEFAGAQAAIARKGKVVFTESYGDIKPGSIIRIFSMTKPVTSAAVMILYEEGKFLLDDPVSKYIPGMDKVKVLAKEDGNGSETVALAQPMTIRHLLTHTSGLSNMTGWRNAKMHEGTLEQMASKLPSIPLATQPGAAWRYGASIDVLGRLIEVWSGQPLDVFLQERIFAPLDMVDTGFFVPAAKLSRLVNIHRLNDDGVLEMLKAPGDPSKKPAFLAGGGGLFSTTADYLRFCQMLLNGGELDGKRILSRTTVDYMMRDHVPQGVMPPNGPNNRKGHGFGFGGAVLVDPAASEVLGYEGDYNWGGAAGTYFWIDRKNELIGVWMVQRPPFTPPPGKKFKVLTYAAME
jgi:CubicO group peptidase (beta-lactamase class C family)